MNTEFPGASRAGFALLLAAFGLICTVPFLSILRIGPQPGFYLESGALLLALLFVLLTFAAGRLNVLPPRGTAYFCALALFWHVQARVMGLDYFGMSDMAVWTFAALALTLWACRGWVLSLGQEKVADALAWALLVGGCLQAAVAVMQYLGWAAHFTGYLAAGAKNNITGQLGQRNHLGHYLMWSLVSAAYLWGGRRLHTALALPLVLYLAGTLGLVNSRTMLLYVAAVAALAALWRLRQGKAGNRLFAAFAFSLAAVVAVQLSLNTLLGWLGGAPVETALQRVGGSSFAMSARDLEWRDAWHVFLTAPLFGHGWDSFSLQGFLAAEFPQGYSPNGISVLFTHSHNIVLQLLAEMGIVGTLLVFGGFLWLVIPYFRRPADAERMFPLALMAVSLCHSMLEYPLWYVYFLVPFAVMAGIAPAPAGRRPFQTAWGIPALLPAAAALVIAAGTVKLGFTYYDLIRFSRIDKNDDYMAVSRKIDGLRAIAAKEPLLAYYAELSLTRRASPADNVIKPWAEQAARRALRHRPYATASQYGLYQYRTGDPEQAARWMRRLYRYYPTSMQYYVGQIHRSPHFAPLYPDLYRACNEYQKLKPRTESCPRP